MRPLQWLGRRDRDLAALRRAGRAAIVMPAMFALGDKVIDNSVLATFAAFGSFAMLLLVDFGGTISERMRAQAALAVVGGVFVCLGTLASENVWLATAAMALVGFAVIFAGVVSSVLAAATTALLLAFILPVSFAGPPSQVPDRLAGWGMAGAAALIAVGLLWPTPTREPLRGAAARACRAVAARLRAEVAYVVGDGRDSLARERDAAVMLADEALGALRREFLATPYRPSGLSTSVRVLVRLVDELDWLDAIVLQSARAAQGAPVRQGACEVKRAASAVLERGADLLEVMGGDCARLHTAMRELSERRQRMEQDATAELPVSRAPAGSGSQMVEQRVSEFITSLDPSFRAHELGFAVSSIAENIDLMAAAERRSWTERLLGRQPEGLSPALAAAGARASAHVDRNSVWLHNSVRGAVGLALAVFVANQSGVQHAFWVVLGTLSVLRSNALNTGENVARALLGTVAGVVLGAGLLALIGTDTTLLWFMLPIAVLFAGIAPAAISFVAGQAAFTVTLVILFNIIQPAGWKIGLLRVEDIALGCGVSLLVGLLFWPRGAGAALRHALADAYTAGATYVSSAVDYGLRRCDASNTSSAGAMDDAARAAAAAGRLDDAFRSYLAERGAKPVPLVEVTSLVSGVGGLRVGADAILDLWQGEDGSAGGDRAAARQELLTSTERVECWYDDLADSLVKRADPREPMPHDKAADGRLLAAVRHDLRDEDGNASATAVRMIWTGDHVDALRRLQKVIVGPAHTAAEQ